MIVKVFPVPGPAKTIIGPLTVLIHSICFVFGLITGFKSFIKHSYIKLVLIINITKL